MKIKVNAKLNLALNVEGMLDEKFHRLSTVMTTVCISDTVTVTGRVDEQVTVTINGVAEHNNAAFKAADAIARRFSKRGADIVIDKKIPVMGGMGGSSAAAAAAIRAMSLMYGLPDDKVFSLAAEFGSDINYLMRGGLALARGKGDDLVFYGFCPKLFFVLIEGPRLTTKDVFARYDSLPRPSERYDCAALIAAIKGGDIEAARAHMGNNLFPAAKSLSPEFGVIEKICRGCSFPAPVMTGSGGNMFILCRGKAEADAFSAGLNKKGLKALSCESAQNGLTVL